MAIRSEYHPLERVVVHKPGYEWNLVTVEHNMPDKYLIEDVLFTDRAAADHEEFTACLRHAAGPDAVIEFADLLSDILSDREVCSDVVGAISALEGVGIRTHDYLISESLDPGELALMLISGAYRVDEGERRGYKVLFPPVPNLMFTRDLGMFFGDAVILSHPAKAIRRREGLLARYILRNHPLFRDIEIIDILDDATVHGMRENVSLEGGDLLVLDADTVIVGSSERTTPTAISLLTGRLLTDGLVKRVIKVDMPIERATMHLDTVFTIVGHNDCVYYPPFFSEEDGNQPLPCSVYEINNDVVQLTETSSPGGLFTILRQLGYPFENRIPCGGDIPHYQTREQWTDGANLFAVKPETAFIYERNTQTIAAFQAAGYAVMTAGDYLSSDPATNGRTIITLSGAELSRGRGGARCMTMPTGRIYS